MARRKTQLANVVEPIKQLRPPNNEQRGVIMKNNKKYLVILLFLFLSFGEVQILHAYTETPVENGGGLSGTITLKGEPPVDQPEKVVFNPEYCGNTVYGETYIVNPQNKGLENVVISIVGIEKGKKAEDRPILLEILKCRFAPHVIAGIVGNSYEVRNLDPIMHNYHTRLSGKTILNVALPPQGKNIKKPLSEVGIINASCDTHTFMKSSIFVAENPYFAVTDKNGNYSISNIPPGKYRVQTWHEGLRSVQEEEVTISPNKKTNLSIDLALQ